jgi:Pretoxin HINT domain
MTRQSQAGVSLWHAVQAPEPRSWTPERIQPVWAFTAKPFKEIEEMPHQDNAAGGFIKGTRAYTKEGIKGIDEIQVGDYVLSSPEDGSGQPEYKRVLRTFALTPQPIFRISIGPEGWESPDPLDLVVAAGSHPFWVDGIGWTRADRLKPEQRLRQGDGRFAKVSGLKPVYRTGKEGIGWATTGTKPDGRGTVFNYAEYSVASMEDREQFRYLPREVLNSDDLFIRVPVFNIEVGDFHTYYVSGDHGFWCKATPGD